MAHGAKVHSHSLPKHSLTGSQKPIKIARIRLKQQREAHKAGAETLHVYLYMLFQYSITHCLSDIPIFCMRSHDRFYHVKINTD